MVKVMQHADSRVAWLTSLNHCLVQFCPRKLGQNLSFTVQQLLVSLASALVLSKLKCQGFGMLSPMCVQQQW